MSDDGSVLGAIVLIVVIVVVIPVSVVMSGAVAAAILGWFTQEAVEEIHEGSELIDLNA